MLRRLRGAPARWTQMSPLHRSAGESSGEQPAKRGSLPFTALEGIKLAAGYQPQIAAHMDTRHAPIAQPPAQRFGVNGHLGCGDRDSNHGLRRGCLHDRSPYATFTYCNLIYQTTI